jgi:hypothetical protein
MSKVQLMSALVLLVAGTALANPLKPDLMGSNNSSHTNTPRVIAPRYPMLQAVVIIGDLKKAIFDGAREVQEGDRISGYTLTKVTANSVTLSRGNTNKILYLESTGDFHLTPVEEE